MRFENRRYARLTGISKKRAKLSSAISGFTLLELLTVVAIVSILAAVLLAGITRFRDQGLAAKCVGNLRGVTAAARLASSENDGKWRIANTDENVYFWDQLLLRNGYLESGNATFCPGWAPRNYQAGLGYGVNYMGTAVAPDNKGTVIRPLGGNTIVEINFPAISKPASFVLLADSYTTRSYLKRTQYSVLQGSGLTEEMHLRHKGRANVAFADGHVSACNKEELTTYGWRYGFDEKGMLEKW